MNHGCVMRKREHERTDGRDMKSEIITLLRQRGDFVSGQELCERFGVSRTAVWKAMEQLKKDGYVIEAVKNRGYLLREDASRVFGCTEIKSRMRTKWAGRTLYYYAATDSTNIQAKRLAEEGAPHGTVVVADSQTAGRGRRGRAWESPAGKNLYFTILLRPEIAPGKASMLTLVMAFAVAKGIRMVLGLEDEGACGMQQDGIAIKWPNDIVIDRKKVCGILTEMSLSVEAGGISYLVIGTGINVLHQDFPEELRDKATTLEDALANMEYNIVKDDTEKTNAERNLANDACMIKNRSMLLCAILEAFENAYDQFCKAGDLSLLQEEYNRLLVNKGRQVKVLDPKGEYEGRAHGITDEGELMVELPDGTIKKVYAGEVSVRGIYGYV